MASMVGMGQALGGTDIVGEVEKLKRLCERTQEQFTDPVSDNENDIIIVYKKKKLFKINLYFFIIALF